MDKITLGVEERLFKDIWSKKILYNNSDFYLKIDVLSFRKVKPVHYNRRDCRYRYVVKISQEDVKLLERIRNKICEYHTIKPFTTTNNNTLIICKWTSKFEKYGFCITTRFLLSSVSNIYDNDVLIVLDDIRELVGDQLPNFF